jgi:hypothetical protein
LTGKYGFLTSLIGPARAPQGALAGVLFLSAAAGVAAPLVLRFVRQVARCRWCALGRSSERSALAGRQRLAPFRSLVVCHTRRHPVVFPARPVVSPLPSKAEGPPQEEKGAGGLGHRPHARVARIGRRRTLLALLDLLAVRQRLVREVMIGLDHIAR